MTEMIQFTSTEQRLLALLEEAGDEEIGTLCNSTEEPRNIEDTSESLMRLLERGYINIATRVGGDLRLVPEPRLVAKEILSGLSTKLKWLDGRWQWSGLSTNSPYVLLTEAGFKSAREILRDHGWQVRGSD